MYVKNIAIVSTNPCFVRFFELECRLLNHTVEYFSKMPPDLEKYSHIFVDMDTIRHFAIDGNRIITVSKTIPQKGSSPHLQWPVTLGEIRETFEDTSAKHPDNTTQAEEDAALWIQSRERRAIGYGSRCTVLSESEFALLEALAGAQKKPVSREMLMGLFGAEQGNIVDVYICLLRKKLEQLCDRRAILTVRGVGYRLILDVKQAENE